jgi:toxin HigB-1
MAIASFRSKPLEELFVDGVTRRIDRRLHHKLTMILDVMHRAESLADVASLPGFHPLAGDLRGLYAISITRNWRLVFGMLDQDIYDVDYKDYH